MSWCYPELALQSLGLAGTSGRSAGVEHAEGSPVTPTRTGLCVLAVLCSGPPFPSLWGHLWGSADGSPSEWDWSPAWGSGRPQRTPFLSSSPAGSLLCPAVEPVLRNCHSHAADDTPAPHSPRPHRSHKAESPLEPPAAPISVYSSQTQNSGKNVLLSMRSASHFYFLPRKSIFFALTEWHVCVSA